MPRKLVPPVLVLTFVLALAGVDASAWDCEPSTFRPLVDTDRDAPGAWDALAPVHGEGHRQFYVTGVATLCQEMCWTDLWVYEESNGIPGLQRADFLVDNTCGGEIPGDTIVF